MASFSPILAFLEDRTEHMGGLLESLTTHYDLCQSTLRQLESHLPLSSPDILPVLSRDAKVVDDVVLDLQESFSKVEAASQDIQDTMSHLYHISAQSESLVAQFDAFSETLSAATHTLQSFDHTQAELASEMQTRLEELWQLADFYDGFVGAYDALVIEVARRIGVQNRMEKVVEDAKRRLDGLLQEDRDERERFREQWGMWLPVDIWPGLVDGPVKWEWEKREPARPLPKLRRELVEKAVMRGGSARTAGAPGGER